MKLEEININGIKIETAHLVLRPFKSDDLNDVYEYAQVPGVGEAAGWKHHESKDQTAAVLAAFIEGRRTFAIEEKESGKVIGSAGLEKSADVYGGSGIGENTNDVGYVIGKDYWGKGYAAEVLQGILSYAFYILHLDAVTCGHFAGNKNSRSLIEKCGFKHITDGKYTSADGAEYNACYYAITHLEYGVDYSKPAAEEAPAEQAEEAPAESAAEEAPAEPEAEEAPAESAAEEAPAEPEAEEAPAESTSEENK